MKTRILLTTIVLTAFALVPLCAQEPPDAEAINKKKTFELLEKAKEEYRIFFKRPQTTIEYWAAIKFEMDLGKFDLAALHLKLLLEKDAKEVDPDLVKLEAAEGMSAFMRLRRVREWSDHPPFQKEAVANVEKLVDRVTEAVHAHLADPVRIRKFIDQLDARTAEERSFAYFQLARSREKAAPYLIEALRLQYGKPLFAKVRETMLRMGPETVPVYLEVFKPVNDKDYKDVELRATLLDIIKERDDKRVIPYLWHMSASKKYPDVIRKKAKETLASLLRMRLDEVPPAKESLAYLAERYYQHKVALPKSVEIWEWNGDEVAKTSDKLSPASAEKFFCERYAREALELDPSYVPAQNVLLSLTLERYYRPEVDQFLMKPMPPKMHELLTTIDADLLMRVLERAMDDKQIPVILPLVFALTERVEQRAVRVNEAGQPRALVRALYYPDRRVQFTAMAGLRNMPPGALAPSASHRVVELASRFLASDMTPKALVLGAPVGQEQPARDVAKGLGFEAVVAKSAADAVAKGKLSADYDLVILYRSMGDADFFRIYGQVRQHYDLGGLPMIVVVETAPETKIAKLEEELLADAVTFDKAQYRWELDKKTIAAAPEAIRLILTSDRNERSVNERRQIADYFRSSWEADKKTIASAPVSIRQIFLIEPKKRTEADLRELELYFRSTFPEFGPLVERIREARRLPDPVRATKKSLASNPNVLVVAEDKFQPNADLKIALDAQLDSAQIVKLKPEERKLFNMAGMDLLWRMAKGEHKGFDVGPALDVILNQLGSQEFGLQAVEILGRLPDKNNEHKLQYKLVGIIMDPARDKLKIAAIQELNRQIQLNGLALDKNQIAELKSAHQEAAEGTPLRSQLNVTLSMIARPTVSRTGSDLFKFRPDPPAPAPPKEEKKDEK